MSKTLAGGLALLLAAFWVGAADARGGGKGKSKEPDHEVSGYTKKDGTYIAPHMQTNPNGTRNDNYSTRGNVNAYTGKAGTKPRDGER